MRQHAPRHLLELGRGDEHLFALHRKRLQVFADAWIRFIFQPSVLPEYFRNCSIAAGTCSGGK